MKPRFALLVLTLQFAASEQISAQPLVTSQPTNNSVSLGARVTLQVTATGAAPLAYQWRFNEATLANATNRTLILTEITAAHAGDYVVTITNLSGTVTSRVARLEVDPAFTKIIAGPVVSNGGYSFACAWGDYDNDGFLDLYVANYNDPDTGHDFLYRNNGLGGFTRVTSGPIVNNGAWSTAGAWADYDNDGDLDLLILLCYLSEAFFSLSLSV